MFGLLSKVWDRLSVIPLKTITVTALPLIVFIAGIIIGARGCGGCAEAPAPYQHAVWVVDEQTRGETARKLSEYNGLKDRAQALEDERERLGGKLIAAVRAQMVAEAVAEDLEAQLVEEGHWRTEFTARGGGTVDFWAADERFAVNHRPWTVGVAGEWFRLKNGQLGLLLNVDTEEITLSQVEFYAADPTERGFFDRLRFGAGVGGAAYDNVINPVVEVSAGFTLDRMELTPTVAYERGPGFTAVKIGVQVNPFM